MSVKRISKTWQIALHDEVNLRSLNKYISNRPIIGPLRESQMNDTL
jgi:hypothetical protein